MAMRQPVTFVVTAQRWEIDPMLVLIGASLAAVGITAFFLTVIILQNYKTSKSVIDLVSMGFGLLLGSWFCFAAVYLLL